MPPPFGAGRFAGSDLRQETDVLPVLKRVQEGRDRQPAPTGLGRYQSGASASHSGSRAVSALETATSARTRSVAAESRVRM